MSKLESLKDNTNQQSVAKPTGSMTSLEAYDQYGAMAYGIILQIIPQTNLAQEVLVNVFSSPLLQACNSYPFTYAVCVIKLARAKAIEAKKKLVTVSSFTSDGLPNDHGNTPEIIFDLAFRQGFSPEEVAEKLHISRSEVLKAFHAFFKSFPQA